MNDSLLTVKQASERLQVSPSMVYALIENGKLGCHRIGLGRGTIRISQSDMESYLAECRQTAAVHPTVVRRRRLRHIRL